jgi:hypothetical protein
VKAKREVILSAMKLPKSLKKYRRPKNQFEEDVYTAVWRQFRRTITSVKWLAAPLEEQLAYLADTLGAFFLVPKYDWEIFVCKKERKPKAAFNSKVVLESLVRNYQTVAKEVKERKIAVRLAEHAKYLRNPPLKKKPKSKPTLLQNSKPETIKLAGPKTILRKHMQGNGQDES